MTDAQKRELRTRKPPAYLNSDEEDADAVLKAKATSKKDNKPVQLQTGQMAKLLVKFISQANQYYRAVLKDAKKQKKDKQKKTEMQPTNPPTITQNKNELIKKTSNSDQPRGPKQVSITKNNTVTKDETISFNAYQEMYARLVTHGASSIVCLNFILNLQNTSDGNKQLAQLKEHYPEIKNYIEAFSLEVLKKNIKKSLLSNPSEIQTKKQDITQKIKGQKVNAGKPKKNVLKQNPTEQFKFKRASFHVAIAYHIHFKQLQKNPNQVTDIDPTIHARRLKQQQIRNLQQQQQDQQNQRQNNEKTRDDDRKNQLIQQRLETPVKNQEDKKN